MNTHLWVVAVVFAVLAVVAVAVWAVWLWRQLHKPDPWTGCRLLVDGQEYPIVSSKCNVVEVNRPFTGLPDLERREARRNKKCL